MRTFVSREINGAVQNTSKKPVPDRYSLEALQRNVGNFAMQRLVATGKSLEEQPGDEIVITGNGPDVKPVPPVPPPPVTANPPKRAGVESFTVKWTENARSGAGTAKLRLDYSAKFKNDATHDPAVAEFRQNAGWNFAVTAGTHSGFKNARPMQDDGYSRADDTAGNKLTDVFFISNDNPGTGIGNLDASDVVDYSFTAEQMIIDTSDNNRVVAKRGPHTGTITGKHPRTFGDVPKTFS